MKKENKHNPISASITLGYDYDASSRNFDDNIQRSPFQNESLFQYIDYGNVKLITDLDELFTIKNNNRKFLIDFLGWTKDEAENYSKDDLRQEIMENLSFGELDRDDTVYTEGLIIERNFELITTRGYSQGDYAQVIIPTKQLREVWGTPKKVKDEDLVSEEYIGNLCWDSPIWGRIEITTEQGTDYEFELYDIPGVPEYLNYPQDVDFVNKKIMEYIKDKFKYVPALNNIVRAVENALPDEIEYPKYC